MYTALDSNHARIPKPVSIGSENALGSSERILTAKAFLDPAMEVPISKHCLLSFVKERFSRLKMPLMDLNVVTASVLVTS